MSKFLLLMISLGIALVVLTAITSPTPVQLQPIAAPNSPCQAIHLNPTDPEAYNPDPTCTPGTLNPAVTQETLATTICKSGYTKTIRPPVSYTNALKKEQILAYGYFNTDLRNYEEDHFISLELGGHPTDPKNLWPEPGASINKKDKVENYLRREICAGRMTLAQAQQKITQDWYGVYLQLYPPPLPEVLGQLIRDILDMQ